MDNVFFTVSGERIRIHSIFTTQQEANCVLNGYYDDLKIVHDAQHGLYFVAYENVEPPFEAVATMRVTADEVRGFNNTLSDDEVSEVLCGVESDMQPDAGSILFWIDEVVKNRIANSCDGQRAIIQKLVQREKAGETLHHADYVEALAIYKNRMSVLGYENLEFHYVEDIINNPLTALPEILSCFPLERDSTNELLIAGALPDEVQP